MLPLLNAVMCESKFSNRLIIIYQTWDCGVEKQGLTSIFFE